MVHKELSLKWFLKEHLFANLFAIMVPQRTIFGWFFFKESLGKRFIVGLKTVLLRHHAKEPFWTPISTFIFLCFMLIAMIEEFFLPQRVLYGTLPNS